MNYIIEKVITDADVVQYLDMNLIIGLLCFGAIIKHLIPKFPNKYIPHTLLGLSLIYTILNSGISANSILNSIIASSIAVGLHSSGKNIIKSAISTSKDIASNIEDNIDEDDESTDDEDNEEES